MELKEAIGRRRSMRFLRPYKPVEREKLQKMLEAARLASFWGNVQALCAVVIERATAPAEVLKALPTGTAIGGFQFRLAPVVIVWTLDWARVDEQGKRKEWRELDRALPQPTDRLGDGQRAGLRLARDVAVHPLLQADAFGDRLVAREAARGAHLPAGLVALLAIGQSLERGMRPRERAGRHHRADLRRHGSATEKQQRHRGDGNPETRPKIPDHGVRNRENTVYPM